MSGQRWLARGGVGVGYRHVTRRGVVETTHGAQLRRDFRTFGDREWAAIPEATTLGRIDDLRGLEHIACRLGDRGEVPQPTCRAADPTSAYFFSLPRSEGGIEGSSLAISGGP